MLESMKDDMGGAAALLGMLDVIATKRVKAHITVIIGAVENLISGRAYKAGDVVKASNGKTIEIANTDAEGRVVLADALTEAISDNPELLIDLATLTGAARIAMEMGGPTRAILLRERVRIAPPMGCSMSASRTAIKTARPTPAT